MGNNGSRSQPPVVTSSVIQVDRGNVPYPTWARPIGYGTKVTRPKQYDLREINPWCHEAKLGSRVSVASVYGHLMESKLLAGCLDLLDALAILKVDYSVFILVFGHKSLSFWGSVVTDEGGRNQFLPYLIPTPYNEIMLRWRSFDFALGPDDLTPLFPS